MRPRSGEAGSDSASYPSELLSYLVLLGGVITGVVSAHMVISTYSSLPYWDEWELVDRLALGKPWSIAWFWAQHNEHRIPFTKILFLADVNLFRGTQVLLLASILLISILHVVLLSWSLRILGGMRGAAWRTGTGLIAFCILSPIQQENLVWGFQVSFIVPSVMATLATLSLVLHQQTSGENSRCKKLSFLLLSIAAATVATFSLANGMLLWPVLLVAAIVLKVRYSSLAAVVAAGAANLAGYLYGYRMPTNPGPRLSFQFCRELFEYITLYFGSTWIHHASGYAPVVIGTIGVSAAIGVAARIQLRRGSRSGLMVHISLLMLFCMATATVTAFGRIGFGIAQAGASRYQVFALLFWCALGLFLLSEMVACRTNGRNLALFSGLIFLVMVAAATQARDPIRDAKWHEVRLRAISNALLADVRDPEQLALAFPQPNMVVRDAEYLRRNRLSIFAGKDFSQLGQPLESFYQLRAGGECSGYIAASQTFPGTGTQALRVTGYAWNRALRAPATRVVFASADGHIKGFGSTVTIPMSSAKPGPEADAKRFGWLGYVGTTAPYDKVEVYAVLEDSASLCPFATIPR